MLAIAALAVVLAGIAAAGLAAGGQGRVVDSAHDLGVASAAFGVSACEVCHLPHDAGGVALRSSAGRSDGDAFSGVAVLCYSCHDGTVTAAGTHAFDRTVGQHPITPGSAGEDCDMCHDPHVPDYGNFLLFPAGANLCKSCHAHAGTADHPLNVDAIGGGHAPDDGHWSPDDSDFSGTRLWSSNGAEAGSYVKCLTCHAAHGAVSRTALLTMNAEEATGENFLCRNCHADLWGGGP